VAKVIKKEEVKEKVKPPEIIPEKKPVIVLKPPDVVPPKKDPPPQPPPPKNSGVVPFKPPAPNTGRPNLVENIVKKPDPQPATGQPVIKEEPYRLPFRFMGIINANESEGPMVLLRDEATGRVVRRREGQSYQDEVNIIKISPSSVEVEVPSKKLRFLYVDSLRQWKQF
jgi:hypothetical protein